MSMFLGPIHQVMYDRITIVNNREEDIAILAEEKLGSKAKKAIDGAREKHGYKCPDTPLSDQIGDAPIHGWLQDILDKVVTSESAVMAAILNTFKDDGEKLILESVFNNGKKAAEQAIAENKGVAGDIESLRIMLSLQLLERMPCDHTSMTTDTTEDHFTVERDLLCNAECWLEAEAPTEFMVQVNSSWIKGFVKACGSFTFERKRETRDGMLTWVDTISKA